MSWQDQGRSELNLVPRTKYPVDKMLVLKNIRHHIRSQFPLHIHVCSNLVYILHSDVEQSMALHAEHVTINISMRR